MNRALLGVAALASLACHGNTGPQPPTSIAVTPPGLAVLTGDTATLSAAAVTAEGNTVTSPSFIWISLDTTRATVTAAGLARGIRPGTTIIHVMSGSLVADVPVAVFSPVDSIDLTPDTLTNHVGDKATLDLFLYDSIGVQAYGRLVHWTTSDSTVVRLDTLSGGPGSPGVAYTALAPGVALIIAHTERKSDTSKVTVVP